MVPRFARSSSTAYHNGRPKTTAPQSNRKLWSRSSHWLTFAIVALSNRNACLPVTIRNAGPILPLIARPINSVEARSRSRLPPALIGLAEQELLERPFADNDVAAVIAKITPRADQLLARLGDDPQAITVVAASDSDRDVILAKVIALVINGRGTPARPADTAGDRSLVVHTSASNRLALAAILPVAIDFTFERVN